MLIRETTKTRVILREPVFMTPHLEWTADLIVHEGNSGVDFFNPGDPLLAPNGGHWNTKSHNGTVLEAWRYLKDLHTGPCRDKPQER